MNTLEGVSSVHSLLFMKSLNQNRDSHFLICSVFIVSKGNHFLSLFSSLQLAAAERLPVHHYVADYILFPLGSLVSLWYI